MDKCQDVDECTRSPCGDNLERFCVNTEGGFECECIEGSWDGERCCR